MTRWEDALGDLVARRGRALVGYAYVLCGDARQAEDLVQDALVKVFARLRAPEPPTAHPLGHGPGYAANEAYVRRAILTLYLDGHRRRRRWAGVRHLVATDDHVRAVDSGATARADVAAALGRLSPRERACVVLRYFEDLTVPQVADALGLAQGTVKRYLADGTRTLREVLQVAPERVPAGPPAEPAGRDRATRDGRTGR